MDFSKVDCVPVPLDEIAFALSLFVNAANCNVPCRSVSHTAFRQDDRDKCEDLFKALCGEPGLHPPLGPKRRDGEASLEQAFRVLCDHYDNNDLRTSVCARVLAFYFLMERSAGAVLAGWLQLCPETPNLVILHPAVISAIATVKLDGSVLLVESGFLEQVERMAHDSEYSPQSPVQESA